MAGSDVLILAAGITLGLIAGYGLMAWLINKYL